MRLKNLWIIIPIVSFWLFYWIAYNYITPHPFENWWGFPLLATLVTSWFLILAATQKLTNGT